MIQYAVAFLFGGFMTFAVTALELNGYGQLSRLAAIFPIVTWISYFFIGDSVNGEYVVSRHALFVLYGTLIAWVPYMLILHYFAPRIGVHKAILLGLVVFSILALAFTAVYKE